MDEGYSSAGGLLVAGVYALVLRGKVVFVGKAKLPLAFVASHRELAHTSHTDFVLAKGVVFDDVWVRPCHPDEIDSEYTRMLAKYKPRHNRPAKVINMRRLGT